jgi:hypothetical protein
MYRIVFGYSTLIKKKIFEILYEVEAIFIQVAEFHKKNGCALSAAIEIRACLNISGTPIVCKVINLLYLL